MLSSFVSGWLQCDFINLSLLCRSIFIRASDLHPHLCTHKHSLIFNWVASHKVDKHSLWICWNKHKQEICKCCLSTAHMDTNRFSVMRVCVFMRLCLHGQEAGQSKRQHQRQCCVASVCQRQRGPWHPCRLPIRAGMELSRPDSTAAHSKLT